MASNTQFIQYKYGHRKEKHKFTKILQKCNANENLC